MPFSSSTSEELPKFLSVHSSSSSMRLVAFSSSDCRSTLASNSTLSGVDPLPSRDSRERRRSLCDRGSDFFLSFPPSLLSL